MISPFLSSAPRLRPMTARWANCERCCLNDYPARSWVADSRSRSHSRLRISQTSFGALERRTESTRRQKSALRLSQHRAKLEASRMHARRQQSLHGPGKECVDLPICDNDVPRTCASRTLDKEGLDCRERERERGLMISALGAHSSPLVIALEGAFD